MKVNKQILASVLLVLFGIVLVADLHILSHDDATNSDDIDCSICDFTSENHTDDFIPTDIVIGYEHVNIPADVVRTNYLNRYFATSVTYSFLNKAPPVA
ncbi:hypothetical protein ABW636_03280 [Aquimarina sp. 2201CG1-2-11]|uniref:hypothetical protein n=1 Tax=Aquimarina discodermiae TaxID=3231043 RepID=UPI0034631682